MTEEILELGKVKKTKAKALTREELETMFARHEAKVKEDVEKIFQDHEEYLDKYIDERCENCSHHDCECPDKIEEDRGRMDRLDENDELLRQGINASHKELSAKLEEEHRLRVATEKKVDALMTFNNNNSAVIIEQRGQIAEMKKHQARYDKDTLRLGVMAGGCLGIMLVVLALAMAGWL